MEKLIKRKAVEPDQETEVKRPGKTQNKRAKEEILNESTEIKKMNTLRESSKNVTNWVKKETILIGDFGTTPSEKIIGFDMDDTLITVKSSSKFPIGRNDWKLLFKKELIQKKMNEYLEKGYKIVIFTNQKGISKGTTSEADITGKLEDINKDLNIPFMAMVATSGDYYRKPCIGLWKILFQEFNSNFKKPDLEQCIYVGDAAGRKVNLSGKKDFSNADYYFSVNINVKFFTPEAFFEGCKVNHGNIDFDPRKLKMNVNEFDMEKLIESLPAKNDIIIFCGSPGSGKTNLYHNFLKKIGYEHVNQDTLKTEQKCVKVATDHLAKGKAVCIDSTNPSKVKRKVFIDLAKQMNCTIRCFYFKVEKDLVFHLNNLRSINIFRKCYTKSVADVIIHTWYKKLEVPNTSEGFCSVEEIVFVPGPFENEQDEELFNCLS